MLMAETRFNGDELFSPQSIQTRASILISVMSILAPPNRCLLPAAALPPTSCFLPEQDKCFLFRPLRSDRTSPFGVVITKLVAPPPNYLSLGVCNPSPFFSRPIFQVRRNRKRLVHGVSKYLTF